jgi:hypothetical protein
MNLGDALAIAEDLRFSLRFDSTAESEMGRPVARRPRLAIGVSQAPNLENWRIAVRVRTESDLRHPIMQRIPDPDVRVTGTIRAAVGGPFCAPGIDLSGPRRPLSPGVSISHERVLPGTLGAFARRNSGEVVLLGASHVLADLNRASVGDSIIQPGKGDSPSPDRVGALLDFVVLDDAAGAVNVVDAAIASLDDAGAVDFSIPSIGRVAGAAPHHRAYPPVRKVGRGSGCTTGRLGARLVYDLPVEFEGRDYFFSRVVEVLPEGHGPFATAGDSGALVVDAKSHAIGLVFASDGYAGYACLMEEVFHKLGLGGIV